MRVRRRWRQDRGDVPVGADPAPARPGRKPLIACPNHLLEQIARDGKRLFPNANILMVAKDDLTRERRKRFAARCATGDWDVVVITHSAFTALAVHPDTEAAWLATQIELYRQAAMALGEDEHRPSRTVKQIAKQADRLEARQRELLEHRTDDGVTFEQLGVDYLLVDEAHYFKRLGLPDPHGRLQRGGVQARHRPGPEAVVAARPQPGRPLRGVLHRHADLQQPGRAVCADDLPDARPAGELRIDSFDAFAGMFIEFKTQIEVAPDGGSFGCTAVRPTSPTSPSCAPCSARSPTSAPATPSGWPPRTPSSTPWSCPPRPSCAPSWPRWSSGPTPSAPAGSTATTTTCWRSATTAAAPPWTWSWSGSPPTTPARSARSSSGWRPSGGRRPTTAIRQGRRPSPVPGALQVVFCDLGTPNRSAGPQVYGKLRRGLVAAGIPADRVRWVHEARTDAAKAALFADCRAGRVSVLLGSTDKLGVGTNIQDRCVAIHHVDAPWRPADVEQREGRGLRPGNHNRRVRVIRYVTEGSFDSYMWQTLERKARFIAQILTGELSAREVEDVDTAALSYAEVKALATGQPLLLEAATVAAEVARLRNLQSGHIRAQRRIRQDIDKLLGDADRSEERAGALEAIAEYAVGRDPVLTSYGGRPLADRGAIAKALAAAAAAALQQGSRQHLGQWCGLSVEVAATQAWVPARSRSPSGSPTGTPRRSSSQELAAARPAVAHPGRPRAARPGRPEPGGRARAAAAAARSRATDSQALSAGRSSTPTSSPPPWPASSSSRRPCATRPPRRRPSPPPRPASRRCTGGRSHRCDVSPPPVLPAASPGRPPGPAVGSGTPSAAPAVRESEMPWASWPGSGAGWRATRSHGRAGRQGAPQAGVQSTGFAGGRMR